MPATASIAALRAELARIGAVASPASAAHLPFGLPCVDAALPGGGLAAAALHEIAGAGADIEHAGVAALFVAGILARARPEAPVLWVAQQRDLFAPGLAGSGLHPDRVIHAEADRPASVLLALEDALRHRGLAGVVGELSGRFSLTASRRLQLASEAAGIPAFVLRRSRRHDDPMLAEPCAAATRWRVGVAPSAPPLPELPEVPGLGRARWRLELIRCRGGDAKSWIVEACDAQGRLGLPAELSHRSLAPARGQGRAVA